MGLEPRASEPQTHAPSPSLYYLPVEKHNSHPKVWRSLFWKNIHIINMYKHNIPKVIKALKGNKTRTKLNIRTLYGSMVQGQILRHYSNLNHAFSMWLHQPELSRATIRHSSISKWIFYFINCSFKIIFKILGPSKATENRSAWQISDWSQPSTPCEQVLDPNGSINVQQLCLTKKITTASWEMFAKYEPCIHTL